MRRVSSELNLKLFVIELPQLFQAQSSSLEYRFLHPDSLSHTEVYRVCRAVGIGQTLMITCRIRLMNIKQGADVLKTATSSECLSSQIVAALIHEQWEPIMAGYAYSAEDVLPEATGTGLDSFRILLHSDVSAGIFSLRRTQYFNKTPAEIAFGHRAATDSCEHWQGG